MTSPEPALRESAWLFTRDSESVRLEVQKGAHGAVRLVILGPGSTRIAHDFPDEASGDAFRERYHAGLVEQGYRLQAMAERRRAGRDD